MALFGQSKGLLGKLASIMVCLWRVLRPSAYAPTSSAMAEVLSMNAVHSRLGSAVAETTGFRALLAQPSVDAGKIAAGGYCLGGAAALELAGGGADLAAVACFHSSLPVMHPEDNRNVRAKVLIQTGAGEPMAPPDVRALFEAQMNAAGVDWRIIFYGSVLHAFTVSGAAEYGMADLRYDGTADERSWRAMLDLFRRASAGLHWGSMGSGSAVVLGRGEDVALRPHQLPWQPAHARSSLLRRRKGLQLTATLLGRSRRSSAADTSSRAARKSMCWKARTMVGAWSFSSFPQWTRFMSSGPRPVIRK